MVVPSVGRTRGKVTVTDTTLPSFLTVWPDGVSRPNASDINFVGGQTVPGVVVVQVGSGGRVDIYNDHGSVDVVVDVEGYFA